MLLTDSQKIELIAQTVDQLARENDLLNFDMRENLQNNQDLNKVLNQNLNSLSQKVQALDQVSKQYEKQVLNVIKFKTFAKNALELLLYISGIVVLYKALVSSLWASIGLKSLYEYFSGNKNFQLAILVFYIVFVLLSLMWLVKKIVKTKKY